jgi:hypothetical protein
MVDIGDAKSLQKRTIPSGGRIIVQFCRYHEEELCFRIQKVKRPDSGILEIAILGHFKFFTDSYQIRRELVPLV